MNDIDDHISISPEFPWRTHCLILKIQRILAKCIRTIVQIWKGNMFYPFAGTHIW